jgi:CheY-like chemotaxis protein
VLLVEDEPGVRELTAEQLRDRGYRVLEADSGQAALRLMQTGVHVDLSIGLQKGPLIGVQTGSR